MADKNIVDAIHKKVPADYYQKHYKRNPIVRYWHRKRIEQLKKYINNKQGNFLDVGCSSGMITNELLNNFQGNAYAIDISDQSIKYAKENYMDINFLVADIEKGIDFESDYIDSILLANVVEHLVNWDIALAEIIRVLKNNGRLIIAADNETRFFRILWGIWTIMAGRVWSGTHVNCQSINKIIQDLEQNGFNLIRQSKTLGNMYWIGEFKINK